MVSHRKFILFLIPLLLLLDFFSRLEAIHEDLFIKAKIIPAKHIKKAPNFTLEDLDGKKVELQSFKGKVILLSFWATWCGPCKKEMPSMEALYKQLKPQGFVLLGVSVDYEKKEKVREFIEKNGCSFPILLDPKLHVYHLYEIKGIPTAILIDKQGGIVGKAVGSKDWNTPEVISLINLLMKQ